jgi:hypothetical protein
LTTDTASRRASVILFGLCVIAASAIAGAAVYRYMFWGDQLPGGFAMNAVDLDGEGSVEYLIAKAAVNLPESGDYTSVAVLLDPATGAAIATTTGRVEMDRGVNIFGTGFWAPDIRKAQVSGPYEMRLTFIREQSDSIFERPASPDMVGRVYQSTFSTPAYDWQSFQEQPAALTIAGPATSTVQDHDADGLADWLSIDVPVSVRNSGVYVVRAESDALFLPGVTDRFIRGPQPERDLSGAQFMSMSPGTHTVGITVAADQVYLSGIDGPMDVHITITSGTDTATSHPCCGTVDPSFSEDPAFAPPPDGSVFGLRAPYLLPPTPVGVRAEAHFSEVVRWYDFEAPWMPVEFVGGAQDFGTDMDGDGAFDYLRVQAELNVRNLGSYDLSGTLYAAGSEPSHEVLMRSTPDEASVVATAWTRFTFNDWSQTQSPQGVWLDFAGAEIIASGLNGPYDVKLRIVPANVIIDPVLVHTSAAYDVSQFEATGAKAARLPAITVSPAESGTFNVQMAPSDLGSEYMVILRIIHANGVVAVDATFQSGQGQAYGVSFRTDVARAADFAVAAYLAGPGFVGVDYLEIPLST